MTLKPNPLLPSSLPPDEQARRSRGRRGADYTPSRDWVTPVASAVVAVVSVLAASAAIIVALSDVTDNALAIEELKKADRKHEDRFVDLEQRTQQLFREGQRELREELRFLRRDLLLREKRAGMGASPG